MERWKDLPPITLNNTSASYLVTLLPVLVSMTCKGDEPQYGEESDKPPWWPSDIQWTNPKFYLQMEKEKQLTVLRKLVHSCYSYHGLADLLCRLEELPSQEDDDLEVIELPEEEDKQDTLVTGCDDPVFVCCFCLEQFSSHDEVSSHQNVCRQGVTDQDTSAEDKQVDLESSCSTTLPSFLGPEEPDDARINETSDFLDAIMCSAGSPQAQTDAPVTKISDSHEASTPCAPPPVSLPIKAVPYQKQSEFNTNNSAKKPVTASSEPYPFVPILKTRSQKRLDQIMLKHNAKKQMLKECSEMGNVSNRGAWWAPARKRVKTNVGSPHPSCLVSQHNFAAKLGLQQAEDAAKQGDGTQQQEVDLDCQIVLVEGPMSDMPDSCITAPKCTATSPRSSMSLMSQLSKDTEDGSSSRRRLSFRFLEDEWADKEAMEEGRDPMQMSLLTIPFSSPLGIRIRKYMGGEGQLNIIKEPEVYCKTEDVDDSYSKLRIRSNEYRVTYRKKRRASRFVHKYKFNRADRREFKRLLQTGLNAQSRHLQRQLVESCVKLQRLKASEIKEWTEGKKVIISERIVVDDDICITQIDIPESQIRKALLKERQMTNTAQRPGPVSGYHNWPANTTYRPGPKSYLEKVAAQGYRPKPKNYSNLIGQQASHVKCYGGVPSPPHVPNIFRNRTSHMPSPPRPYPVLTPKSPHSASLGFKAAHTKGRLSDQPGRLPASHLSQHMTLGPSVHNEGYFGKTVAGASGSSSPSRRKQTLTQLRRDDAADGHSRPKAGTPYSLPRQPLSVFETVRIKNGKISSGSQGFKTLSPNTSHAVPVRKQQGVAPVQMQRPLSRPSHLLQCSRPLPDWGSPQATGGLRTQHEAGRMPQSSYGHMKSASSNLGLHRNHQGHQGLQRSQSVIQNPHRQHMAASNLINKFAQKPPQGQARQCSPAAAGHVQNSQSNGSSSAVEIICIDD